MHYYNIQKREGYNFVEKNKFIKFDKKNLLQVGGSGRDVSGLDEDGSGEECIVAGFVRHVDSL